MGDPAIWASVGLSLVGIVFWLGVQRGKLIEMAREIRDLKTAIVLVRSEVELKNQAIPVAQLSVKIEGLSGQVDDLRQAFDDFRKSVFVQALRLHQGESSGV
jgi:UDP-N-acetyl-D-mannosaminuronate dehydrogenase